MTTLSADDPNPPVVPDSHHVSTIELFRLREAVTAELATRDLGALSNDEVLEATTLSTRTEHRADGVNAAVYIELSDRGCYRKVGYLSPRTYLAQGQRLGDAEAKRRQLAALAIGRLTSMTGERLAPNLPATADAVSDGAIGTEHVLMIDSIMDKIPVAVPADVKARAEAQLAEAARTLAPNAVGTVGNRLLAHLDPDGELTDDRDRKRTRGFTIQAQDRRLMSKVRALLKPELRAKLEALLLQWAAPGMNNPDDPDSPKGAANAPGADPALIAAAAERDDRTTGQRNHDALAAMCDFLIGHGGLGQPTSLPAHLVVTASLKDLEDRAGIAHTATGTRLPVKDLVELAADAVPWLEIFQTGTAQVLHLTRTRRLASLPQRLALFGRDRGCTAPGCTAPFNRVQAHHMPDWQDGGPTDIDHLGGACGGHNRSVKKEPGGWETTILTDGPYAGRVAWRPAGSTEPWRINHTLHPEKLKPDDPAPPGDASGPPAA